MTERKKPDWDAIAAETAQVTRERHEEAVQSTLTEWPGDPAWKRPSACNDEQNTWRVFHRDIPGRIIAEFYGEKAEQAAREFCRLAAK